MTIGGGGEISSGGPGASSSTFGTSNTTRRLSEVSSGISAIFNPSRLRRNSAAVSQIGGNLTSGQSITTSGSRNPSVVVTDDDDFTLSLPIGRAVTFERSVTVLPIMSGESSSGGGTSRNRGGGGSGPGSATSASSVPLLTDVQAQSNSNAIVTLESSLVHQSSLDQPLHGRGSLRGGTERNNNNPSDANLKPIAKTFATLRRAIFSKTARKLCCGMFLSVVVGLCWTTIIQAIKRAYNTTELFANSNQPVAFQPMTGREDSLLHSEYVLSSTASYYTHYPINLKHPNYNNLPNQVQTTQAGATSEPLAVVNNSRAVYEAPFFTAWLLTASTILFYPLHQLTVRFCSCMGRKGTKTMSRAISDAIQGFREHGITLFSFLGRCAALCCLWLTTNYLLLISLRKLQPTESLALFSTTTSFSYLLSWVILHQQFVGLRILAVILSNMGIALLAYMDGHSHKSETLGYVVLGALSAGCAAIFKVSLKKSFGFGATVSQQVALIFSVIGIMSVVLLWPIFVTLYFTGVEVIFWSAAPWRLIGFAVSCFLLVSMLDNFGVTCTFEFFITVGLLFAIPISAALDIYIHDVEFYDMRLAGIVTVSIGFCVVLVPENWPDYITRCIRRLRGPPPEEEPPIRYSSALPRLSRAGLEHHYHLVHPPPSHQHQHHLHIGHNHYPPNQSNHHHNYPSSNSSIPLHHYQQPSPRRTSLASFNPLHHFSNHHF